MTATRESKPSDGKLLGCATAFLFFAAIGFVLFFAMIWGGAHCEPVPACRQYGARQFLLGLVALLATASALGLIVRYLVRFVAGRLNGRNRMLVGSVNVLLMALILWLALEATRLIAITLN